MSFTPSSTPPCLSSFIPRILIATSLAHVSPAARASPIAVCEARSQCHHDGTTRGHFYATHRNRNLGIIRSRSNPEICLKRNCKLLDAQTNRRTTSFPRETSGSSTGCGTGSSGSGSGGLRTSCGTGKKEIDTASSASMASFLRASAMVPVLRPLIVLSPVARNSLNLARQSLIMQARSGPDASPDAEPAAKAPSSSLSKASATVATEAEARLPAIADTRWKINLNIGREKNTWMPPLWAASGRRMEIHMECTFQKDGGVAARIGPYLPMDVRAGKWDQLGNVLKFWVEIGGFERFDVSLPSGRLYFTTNVWGDVLRARGNVLTIRATRFWVRRESRTVGTFTTERISGQDAVNLPPCRSYIRGDVDDQFFDEDLC